MTLAHDVVGAASTGDAARSRTVVFLHGILGSRNNWKSFATKLVAARPSWRAVLCDLRNHGDSHGASFAAPHTLSACADDVRATVPSFDVVVGHSFGGKVALELARRDDRRPRATWVLDCPPGTRSFGGVDHSEIARVLDAIGRVPMPVASRAALVATLRASGLSEALAMWMTTNLRAAGAGDGFVWKFALAAIPEMLTSFGNADYWSVVEEPHGVVLVRAGKSDRWQADDLARVTRAVARGTVVEHVMPNAGHWLHTDDPATLLGLLTRALGALE